MKVLHCEASPGWGGQEIRILKESLGMRERGHKVVLAVQKGGGLVEPARKAGFLVFELNFCKRHLFSTFFKLLAFVRKEKIDLINTHSSLDAWLGGVVGRCLRVPVVRTRHLSTPIREGLNSLLLYNALANFVVTTCEETAIKVRKQAKLTTKRCQSIPTGIDPKRGRNLQKKSLAFRQKHGIAKSDVVAGTCCVLRGWKGVSDLLLAAKALEKEPNLKWMVIGSGVSESHFLEERKKLGLQHKVIFVGHQDPPDVAMAALDVFLLLSWAHEGVSQASLQAALLKKPLITTPTGGLKEVCLPEKTGYLVAPKAPSEVALALKKMLKEPHKREEMGERAKGLVLEKFTYEKMLEKMEEVFNGVCQKKK